MTFLKWKFNIDLWLMACYNTGCASHVWIVFWKERCTGETRKAPDLSYEVNSASGGSRCFPVVFLSEGSHRQYQNPRIVPVSKNTEIDRIIVWSEDTLLEVLIYIVAKDILNFEKLYGREGLAAWGIRVWTPLFRKLYRRECQCIWTFTEKRWTRSW